MYGVGPVLSVRPAVCSVLVRLATSDPPLCGRFVAFMSDPSCVQCGYVFYRLTRCMFGVGPWLDELIAALRCGSEAECLTFRVFSVGPV